MSSPCHTLTVRSRAAFLPVVALAASVLVGCGGGSSGGSTSTVVVTSPSARSTSTAHPGHTTTTPKGAAPREPAGTSTGVTAAGSAPATLPSPGGRLLGRYAGNGNARLGTIVAHSPSVLAWSAGHPGMQIFTSSGFILVDSNASSGAIRLSAGTYRGVRVAARAAWAIELRSRSAH